jgi:hypothetical protein
MCLQEMPKIARASPDHDSSSMVDRYHSRELGLEGMPTTRSRIDWNPCLVVDRRDAFIGFPPLSLPYAVRDVAPQTAGRANAGRERDEHDQVARQGSVLHASF